MSTIIASLFSGLGFFFLGLYLISSNIHLTGSRQIRGLIARWTDRVWLSSLLGVLAGAVMQSTSAVTVILASMTASGLITVRRALPIVAWTNVGTTFLVFFTILDVRLAALYSLGVTAIGFSFTSAQRWKTVFAIALGISLLFLGLDEMKVSGGRLQTFSWFQIVMEHARGSFGLAFIAGAFLSFITQSTTAVTLLAVTLIQSGLLPAEETMMVIYGGNVGSSFSRMLMHSGLRGSSRQVGRFQDLVKISAAILFLLLFYLEVVVHVPLVQALVERLTDKPATQMALVNLLFNLTPAVVFTLFLGPTQRLLERFWPATPAEDFAKVQYLYPEALKDPDTALDLVEKEQMRLLFRLPDYLTPLKIDVAVKKHANRALHESFAILAREVAAYCTALLELLHATESSERLINLQNRQNLIEFLEDGVYQMITTVEQAPHSGKLVPMVQDFAEALDFLLLTASDAASTLSAEDAQLLANLSADRGDLMGRIRRLYLSSEQDLSPSDKSLLLSLTSLFERIVWIIHRLAILLKQNQENQE